MNGQYYRWTMKDGREDHFVTQKITPDFWQFTDSQAIGAPIQWRAGDVLEMRAGEQDEIIGYPSLVRLLGFSFDAKAIGAHGAITAQVEVLQASPLAGENYAVGKTTVFDSELARGAYRLREQHTACTAA